MKLTKQQAAVLEAVLTKKSDTLVFAPPGAGKTTIALLCAREYAKRLEPLQRVFFLTFSNSAVDAITSRRRNILTGLHGAKVEVTNFHQFTLSILRSYGPAVGLGLPIRIIDSITKRYLERAGTDNLLRMGYLPFDRFVPLANEVFSKNLTLRSAFAATYPLIIVDEFQDTYPAQWEFVRHLASSGRLLCLADPNQMIYEFTKNQAKAELLTFIHRAERHSCRSTAILCRTNRMAEMVSRWLGDKSVGGASGGVKTDGNGRFENGWKKSRRRESAGL